MDKRKDLWEGALEHFGTEGSAPNGGLAINGGYFIVPGNLNRLYPNLTTEIYSNQLDLAMIQKC